MADLAQRLQLIEAGEQALAAGDVEAAASAFERAAGMVHSQDVELGIVRTQMQAGQYRQALSFASHAAGAHPRAPAGTALYVWLLHIGGQGNAARRYLQEGLQRHPEDPALRAAQALVLAADADPAPALMSAPLRVAPYAHGELAAAQAIFAGTAWLVAEPGGARLASGALVPAHTLDGASHIWVRNGLGQTARAERERRETSDGTNSAPALWLRLSPPLPLPDAGLAQGPAARPPFAGSPAYTVEYAATPGSPAAPAWPLLRQGFFGHLPPLGQPRPLTLDLPPGPRGGPVFDAQGRLAGLAVSSGPGRVAVAGPTAQATAGEAGGTAVPTPTIRTAVDQIYEAALRLALQVLVQR